MSVDGLHGRTNGKGRSPTAKASGKNSPPRPGGALVARRYTVPGTDPLAAVEYVRRDSVIQNPDGSVVFATRGAEIPAGWSQLATDIVVSKYFRKSGLHGDP